MSWLVFGASQGVGGRVLATLVAGGERVHAVSRRPQPARPGVVWHGLDLHRPGVVADEVFAAGRVVSAGPLDGFARFAGGASWGPGTRVVALSSMSALTKAGKGHPQERRVAAALKQAEQRLQARCDACGWSLCLLRPTLIWGAGDRSITPLVRFARRHGWLPLPAAARGGRQPVHADDLAALLLAASRRSDLPAGPWPAAGGEALAFVEMVRRAVLRAAPDARVVRVPAIPAAVIGGLAHIVPGRAGLALSQLRRGWDDLSVDDDRVWKRLGIRPRPFEPGRGDFD